MKPTDKELADLNAEMHKLCGWHYDPSRHAWHRNGYWTAELDNYTSDRAAAMEVLEICAEKDTLVISKSTVTEHPWVIVGRKTCHRSCHPTLPLTICNIAKQLHSK